MYVQSTRAVEATEVAAGMLDGASSSAAMHAKANEGRIRRATATMGNALLHDTVKMQCNAILRVTLGIYMNKWL
jgi:hypothetical protein